MKTAYYHFWNQRVKYSICTESSDIYAVTQRKDKLGVEERVRKHSSRGG